MGNKNVGFNYLKHDIANYMQKIIFINRTIFSYSNQVDSICTVRLFSHKTKTVRIYLIIPTHIFYL